MKEIYIHILANPDRDSTQALVTTVLRRLANKGWLRREAKPQAEGG